MVTNFQHFSDSSATDRKSSCMRCPLKCSSRWLTVEFSKKQAGFSIPGRNKTDNGAQRQDEILRVYWWFHGGSWRDGCMFYMSLHIATWLCLCINNSTTQLYHPPPPLAVRGEGSAPHTPQLNRTALNQYGLLTLVCPEIQVTTIKWGRWRTAQMDDRGMGWCEGAGKTDGNQQWLVHMERNETPHRFLWFWR